MIGERLYDLRKDYGLSQKELGEKIAVSHHTISSYEKDKSDPSDEIKIKLAQFFNVSLDYLVGLIDEPLPYQREKNLLYIPQSVGKDKQELLREFIQFIGADEKPK